MGLLEDMLQSQLEVDTLACSDAIRAFSAGSWEQTLLLVDEISSHKLQPLREAHAVILASSEWQRWSDCRRNRVLSPLVGVAASLPDEDTGPPQLASRSTTKPAPGVGQEWLLGGAGPKK